MEGNVSQSIESQRTALHRLKPASVFDDGYSAFSSELRMAMAAS